MKALIIARNAMIAGFFVALLSLGGAVAAGAGTLGGGGAALSVGALIALLIGALGSIVFVVSLFVYVFLPAFNWSLASYSYGGYVTVLAALAVAVIISNVVVGVIALPQLIGSAQGGSLVTGQGAPTVELLLLSAVTLDVPLFLIVWARIVHPGVITWRQMGLTRESLGQKIIVGVLAGFGILVVAGLLELTLQRLGIQQTQQEMFAGVKGASTGAFALVFLAVGVLAPTVEELFFRGYVFTAFRQQKGLWQAFLISSAIFAVLHLNLPALLPLFVIGLALSAVYHYSGSLVPAIIAHGINNTVAVIGLYLISR